MSAKIGYQFGALRHFSTAYETLADRMTLPKVREIAVVYSANMRRVRSLCAVPVELIYWSSVFSECAIEARHSFTPPRHMSDPCVLKLRQEMFSRFNVARAAKSVEELEDEVWSLGASNLSELLAAEKGTEPSDGIQATFSAAIMESWSALESLAIDLWIEAVNQCPSILAGSFSKNQVTFKELSDFGYHIDRQIGKILYETKKVDFSSLKNVKSNYANAFGLDSGGDIDNIFSPYNTLDAISQLRNCLAHRAGVIDRKAVGAVRLVAGLGDIRVGDRVKLTGVVANGCISLTVERAMTLCHFVNDWLRDHASECEERSRRRSGQRAPS